MQGLDLVGNIVIVLRIHFIHLIARIPSRGGMMLWFAPMYVISFPLVAYVFLPVLYNLKLTTIYEMLLYNSVALYAPSLAIAAITKIPIAISIFITAILSAVYISIGGAKAGIYTSAVQMALIFLTMAFIISIALQETSIENVYTSVLRGRRLILNDFRVDPTIRHSAWSLVIGGTGNILSLFAANQLSIQRYMAMDSLKSAQKVVLLNIVCNSVILFAYVSIGFLIYSHYHECHPKIGNANELLPQFVTDVISQYPGSVGLFAAAVYSAGISTLSASFTAVSSIVINDVWKVYRVHRKMAPLKKKQVENAMRVLPIILSFLSIFVALLCSMLQSIILQVSFIVFGAGGGPVLGSFVVGLFVPYVKGKSAFIGLISSIIACFAISIGSVLVKVKPVPLQLGQCFNETVTYYDESLIGQVTSTPLAYGLDRIFAVSYQYYSIIAVITNVAVSLVLQKLFEVCSLTSNQMEVSLELVSPLLAHSYPSSQTDPELKAACTQQDSLP
ncbi:unnamed protein product [Caenorhabditis sp. 36 PRJEB53466]|nr:unnamed protein product [Caenorhabditis sp. 36 PRJEB53466]